MAERIITFLEKHNILNKNQHGFCAGRSTNTVLLDIMNSVYKGLDNTQQTLALVLI